MKYLLLSIVVFSLYSCKKHQASIDDLETKFETVNAQGTTVNSFQLGDEISFRYSILNESDYAVDYYNDNCPMMSCRIYDSNDNLIGDLFADTVSCHDAILMHTLQSKEQKSYQSNWSDDPNNSALPAGNYKAIIQDYIDFSESSDGRTINLVTYFTVE